MSKVDNPMIRTQELACILMKKQYDEMCEVLQWATNNIDCVYGPYFKRDCTAWDRDNRAFEATTLYEALKSAWEARDREA